jgi:hypothetical protein
MPHVKKDRGDLGVAKCIADVTLQGWVISIPITEHATYDLVAEKGGVLLRLQVKYRTAIGDKVCIGLKGTWSDKWGSHIRPFKSGSYDILAVYCPDTDTCYYVKEKEFSTYSSAITLRLKEAKNSQKSGVRMASQYTKLQ